jgi:spore coat polysaccharide biosynthesis protein SpsF
MKIIAIVQARMGSTRLPGKAMIELGGRTVLQRVTERLRHSSRLQDILVATTSNAADDVIVRECQRLGVSSFRGSEHDVLDRYYRAASEHRADSVVRITSDCPLIDPVLVDQAIRVFLEADADYLNNASPRTYPRGLDVEVMKMSALEKAWRVARQPHEREHVTPYLYEHPELFQLAALTGATDYSRYRWTLDTPNDLQMLTALYSKLGDRDDFSWEEIISIMEREPQLAKINAEVVQKSLHSL